MWEWAEAAGQLQAQRERKEAKGAPEHVLDQRAASQLRRVATGHDRLDRLSTGVVRGPLRVPSLGDLGVRMSLVQAQRGAWMATFIFLVAYFASDQNPYRFVPGIGQANLSNVVLGVTLGLSLLCIGLGAVHWAKTLMPDTEVTEARHPQRSSDDARAEAVETIMAGVDASQLARRPLIKYMLGGALGLFALPLGLQLAGSPGPLP